MTIIPWRGLPPTFRFTAIVAAILALDAAVKLWIAR